jgi:hypothetical protein
LNKEEFALHMVLLVIVLLVIRLLMLALIVVCFLLDLLFHFVDYLLSVILTSSLKEVI